MPKVISAPTFTIPDDVDIGPHSTIALTKAAIQGQVTGGGGDGPPDIAGAPVDGQSYGRQDGDWAPVLSLDGGVLTGPLTLAADPAGDMPLAATTKHYVDAVDNLKANVHGDAFTGPVLLSGPPSDPLEAATKAYVDGLPIPAASNAAPKMDGTATAGSDPTWSRSNHVHPTDTSRYAADNPDWYQTADEVSSTVSAALLEPRMGVADGTDAGAGEIGEYVVSANQTGILPTNGVPLTITSIDLSPGCWEAWGMADFLPDASKNLTMICASITASADTLPTDADLYTGVGIMTMFYTGSLTAGSRQVLMTGQCRVNSATPFTLYVVSQASWSGSGNCLTKGYICARRVR